MTEPVTEDGIESAWNACKYRGYCSRLHVENADVMVERDRLHAEVERLRAELARLTTLRPASEHKTGERVLIWEEARLHADSWLFFNHGTRVPTVAWWTPLPDVKEPK